MISRIELSYCDAGVDIDFASSCLGEIDKTRSRAADVIHSPNDFAGLFSLKQICQRYDDPVLVSGTDGIGTKLLVAIACEKFDGLGQDLVAMCVNDIATKGAEPLFFLDYFATSNLRTVPFKKVVNSIVSACDEINCALIGGETAEMPALYHKKHFDLAGFAVGVVERAKILGAHRVKANDVLIGIASSGLHSNGFSLVRKIMFDKLCHRANDVLWQTERGVRTVADELLVATRLYPNLVQALCKENISVNAIAHITGGGLTENVPRILPKDLMAHIDLTDVNMSPIFNYLMEKGPVSPNEMLRVFNMGIGMVIAMPRDQKDRALSILDEFGDTYEIGEVLPWQGGPQCHITL